MSKSHCTFNIQFDSHEELMQPIESIVHQVINCVIVTLRFLCCSLRNSTIDLKLLQINGFVYDTSYIFISGK